MGERHEPNVDRVTSELEELIAQFSGDEIATGVVNSGAAVSPDERLSVELLLDLLQDALRRRSGG